MSRGTGLGDGWAVCFASAQNQCSYRSLHMRSYYIECRKLALAFHSLCFLVYVDYSATYPVNCNYTAVFVCCMSYTNTDLSFFFNVGQQNISESILNPQFKYSSLHFPRITCRPDSSFLFPVSTRKISGEDIKKILEVH